MKVIFYIVGLSVSLVLLGFLLPKEVSRVRSVRIKASKEAVFREVSSFKGFPMWSPFYKQEPKAKRTYTGPDSGVGAQVSWDGQIIEQGKAVIVDIVGMDTVRMELYFGDEISPFGNGAFYLVAVGEDSVQLTWRFWASLGMNPINRYKALLGTHPINRYQALLVDESKGPNYAAGLQALKTHIETGVASVVIDEKRLEAPMTLIGLPVAVRTHAEIEGAMRATFQKIRNFTQAQGLKAPTYACVYIAPKFRTGKSLVSFVAGVLTEEDVISPDLPEGFVRRSVPSGFYLRALHKGSYDGLSNTHATLRATWLARNYVVMGPPWEAYTVHEEVEPDTAKWETYVHYPVRPAGEEPEN